MCLRMGEDTPATISLSPYSLFISLIFFPPRHLPRLALMSLPYDHYRFHFSTPLFFLHPLVCSSLCSLLVLIQSPPRRLLSVSVAFSLPPTGELLCYLITLTVQDVCECVFVGVCVCLFFSLCACVCVCLSVFEGQVQGLGADPTRYPCGTEQQRERRQVQPRKKQN